MGVSKTVFFTEKEQKVIDALIEKTSYERASTYLKTQGLVISANTMRGMTLRIRNRYGNAKLFVDKCKEFEEALGQKNRKLRYFIG